MSAFGVKRTWPIAVQVSASDPKRTLLAFNVLALVGTMLLSLASGGGNEAARVHITSRWSRGRLTDRRARAK